jgi:hypothetical protein
MLGYDDDELIRLVLSFSLNGRRYESGWTGSVFAMNKTIAESRATDLYEINLHDDESSGKPRASGLLLLPSAYFERTAEVRRPGELRQGDRVKLVADLPGGGSPHTEGQVGTVITTRVKPDRVSCDVALDFDENINVPRDLLEHLPGLFAQVAYSDDEGVRISFDDGSAR